MKHVYENIPGWFDYADLFEKMVKEAPENAKFVEVGVFIGQSTAHLLVECVNANKGIQVDVVDNFSNGVPNSWPWSGPRDQFECFKWNMERFNLSEHCNIIVEDAAKAASQYEDYSLDFVFLDTAHVYGNTKNEINAWMPKIKNGGYIGGHDYFDKYPGHMRAIDEVLGERYLQFYGEHKSTWLYDVQH